MTPEDRSFDLAPGFSAAAVACGLKSGGALDLALITADEPCPAAGVFTTNRVQAAPVRYDREILVRRDARVRAVVANAGCANACTGERGMEDVRRTAALAARALACEPDQVLVLSTGVIGRHLDMEKVARGIAAPAIGRMLGAKWGAMGHDGVQAVPGTKSYKLADALKAKLPKMLKRDFSPQFALELMDKDLRYFLALAHELDRPVPIASLVRSQYHAARRASLGKLDSCAVFLQAAGEKPRN